MSLAHDSGRDREGLRQQYGFRDPARLMEPARLAALQPTRLSATRSLVNRMLAESWAIELEQWEIDEHARGEARYRVTTPSHVFDFVVFSFEPSKGGRSPRIIGQSWDMMGALVEGPVTDDQVQHTRRELPKLYSGRAAEGTLVWCRSNRSGRIFDHVVRCLSEGQQPDVSYLSEVCYLMRNTGLDGNGTFGTKSFLSYSREYPLQVPYHPQMLAAYLMREFSFDLVQYLARCVSPRAVPLESSLKRFLALGNGSALGLVLWVNNHPHLVNRWLSLRERALGSAVRLPVKAGSVELNTLLGHLSRAITYRRQDPMSYDSFPQSSTIAAELDDVRSLVDELYRDGTILGETHTQPLDQICEITERRADPETAETLNSLLIELVPQIADDLARQQVASETLLGKPDQTVDEFRNILHEEYQWAFQVDLAANARKYVWYKSRNAEEPRCGPYEEVPEGTVNMAVDLPEQVQRLDKLLDATDEGTSMAQFLVDNPYERYWVERIQSLEGLDYHSPHMDSAADNFRPVHIIRLVNVAFYGLDKTRDYLDRNLRGLMFHGAPTREELDTESSAAWFWPTIPTPYAESSQKRENAPGSDWDQS